MTKEELQELISRYREGKATPAEIDLLEGLYDRWKDLPWDVHALGDPEDIKKRLVARLEAALQKRSIPFYKQPWFRVAAAAVLLLGTVIFFLTTNMNRKQPSAEITSNNTDFEPAVEKAILLLDNGISIALDTARNGLLAEQGNSSVLKSNGLLIYDTGSTVDVEVMYNTLSVPKGGTYSVVLSDGTKVWLNAGSSLHFPTRFSGKERRVKVTGEAYFQVVHQEQQPFVVNVADLEVHDLGTEFNINAYEDEPAIAVTLVNGLARVNNQNDAVELTPGTVALSYERTLKTEPADIELVTAWKNGLFQFKHSSIESIMRQIGRWYDVDIEFRGKIEQHFDGSIYRSTKASNVFRILEEEGNVRFQIEGQKVVVLPAKK